MGTGAHAAATDRAGDWAACVGGSDGNAPLWSMGWDRRSVRLKVLDNGTWHTYLLPKAAHCNDASHGWYPEWPRIRKITDGRWMMDMHGMFFDFPPTFSAANSGGIRPIGSHLRYVPDFCEWNDRLVLATDETSIQGNRLAGQPQSNLWFGSYEDLKTWGPASGYGGPWLEDRVRADEPSDPFLVAGFDRRVIHLAVGRRTTDSRRLRTTDQLAITRLPDLLSQLPSVTVRRGSWKKPAALLNLSKFSVRSGFSRTRTRLVARKPTGLFPLQASRISRPYCRPDEPLKEAGLITLGSTDGLLVH